VFGEGGGKGVTKVLSLPTLVHVLSRPSPAQATLATNRSFYVVPMGGDAPEGLHLGLELKKIGDHTPPRSPPFPFFPSPRLLLSLHPCQSVPLGGMVTYSSLQHPLIPHKVCISTHQGGSCSVLLPVRLIRAH
jgi:hypothetical protein